jgi:tetratricopeptide (TPR) repeat protein
LSKVNAIRKKALEYVRKQDWRSATKEYKRLAELDHSNPNVFNELGDIYLKTGNKSEAYDSFSRAIDSYTRVSLHNNAVAVCKKVLRLIPTRYEVLIKLGLIRKKQGLVKEAESYYFSFLDKVLVDQQISPVDVQKNCAEISEEMGDSAPVLERLVECLTRFNLKDETPALLHKLYRIYSGSGDEESSERTRQLLEELGITPEEPPEPAGGTPAKEGAVITEDNIWTEAHTEGERIDVDRASPDAAPADAGKKSVYEYGDVQIAGTDGAGKETSGQPAPGAGAAKETSGQPAAGPATDTIPAAEPEEKPGEPAEDPAPAEKVYDIGEASPAGDAAPAEVGADELPDSTGSESDGATKPSGSPADIQVSAILDNGDAGNDTSEEDYRSHYDLGMAYLEMDLLPEAIREYQFASKSPQFQARALEMIGLCFLKQNQANLAIKQLNKGLQVVGDASAEALGIKYNLGLAYEMAGDLENAKSAFEDVYVEDVTFRDVAKKIEQLS